MTKHEIASVYWKQFFVRRQQTSAKYNITTWCTEKSERKQIKSTFVDFYSANGFALRRFFDPKNVNFCSHFRFTEEAKKYMIKNKKPKTFR